MEEITLTINGQHVSCRSGISILVAAKENGIRIPNLCSHPHLEPAGACRVCIVEEGKSGRILASCATPASSGMAIQTDSPTVKRHRTNIVRLMMANHPESCIVCDKGNRCELRKMAAELGIGRIDLYPMPQFLGLEAANPFIIRDLSKCILCGKCIRADQELVVVGAIDNNHRGFPSRPATLQERPLERSSCTFCGTCVSMCPTGALMPKIPSYAGTPQREARTLCGFCAVGCSLKVGIADQHVVEINPTGLEETVNRSTLCVRGHFAHDFLNTGERLTAPMIRKNGAYVVVSWEEALEGVCSRMLSIKERFGPQALGFLGSSKCTVEENYLFQKLARVAFRTNNVDNGGSLNGRRALALFYERLGGRWGELRIEALENAELIFVIGADPAHSAPVLGYTLKRAARRKGIPLVLVDPRWTELVPFARQWLPLNPNADAHLLSSLAHLLIQGGGHDQEFIRSRTRGYENFAEGIARLDIAPAAKATGLAVSQLEETAALLQGKRVAFVVGSGVLQKGTGVRVLKSLLNLALLVGSLGAAGAGFLFVLRENNQRGAWDMGSAPDFLPGGRPVWEEGARKRLEHDWGMTLSPDPGLGVVRMLQEAEKGNIRGLYVMGENPVRSLPQSARVKEALSKMDFLVVQDILPTETSQLAEVILPGAAVSEKEGSFTNLEGRIQGFRQVTDPPGEARPDWEILDHMLAKVCGSRGYGSMDALRWEIVGIAPPYRGLTEGRGELWVQEMGTADGEEGQRIEFTPLRQIQEGTATACEERGFPFVAILGSHRFHLGSGTRTSRSRRIMGTGHRGEVEMNALDAEGLGVSDGDKVRLISAHGTLEREAKVSKRMRPGMVFIPLGFQGNDALELMPLQEPERVGPGGWKSCQVKIEKVEV